MESIHVQIDTPHALLTPLCVDSHIKEEKTKTEARRKFWGSKIRSFVGEGWIFVDRISKTVRCHKIAQVIPAFWLVLACDLLEDNRTIDVIIRSFSFCILKWRKVLRIKIIFYEKAETRSRKKEEKGVFRKWLSKNTRTFPVTSWARLNQAQNWSCFVSNLTNPINCLLH